MRKRGPCAKRAVTCRIESVHPSGEVEWVEGSNDCANPQSACPRLPGEGYAKCQTVCQQDGHAETQALALARQAGISVLGGRAILRGHYWMCKDCGEALYAAGVRVVVIHMEAP